MSMSLADPRLLKLDTLNPAEIIIYLAAPATTLFKAYKLSVVEFYNVFRPQVGIVHVETKQHLPWSLYRFNDGRCDPASRFDPSSSELLAPGDYMIHHDDFSISDGAVVPQKADTTDLLTRVSDAERYNPSRSSPASQPSARNLSFKDRLLIRDRACVVCHACGLGDEYKYDVDDSWLKGTHIVPISRGDLWDFANLVEAIHDPWTANIDTEKRRRLGSEGSSVASCDTRRINSLENGLLLCVTCHAWFNCHLFVIRPYSHTILALHPRCAKLNGIKVVKPWECPNAASFPPPSDIILQQYWRWVVYSSMKAATAGEDIREYWNDEDDDDDSIYLAEENGIYKAENAHEAIRTYLEDVASSSTNVELGLPSSASHAAACE